MSLPVIALAATALFIYHFARSKPSAEAAEAQPEIDETPDPPMLGAVPGCYSHYYGSSSSGLSQSVLSLMNPAARSYVTPPNGRRIWSDSKGQVHVFQPGTTRLTPQGQVQAFKAAVAIMGSPERSTPGDVTRRVLRLILPECDWDADFYSTFGHKAMSKQERNLWVSVWYLVQAAARQVGYKVGGDKPWRHLMIPVGDRRGLVIGRGYLGMPDIGVPGKMFLEPGRRVELLVGDYRGKSEWPRPPFFHSDRVVARVIESKDGRPLVQIVGTFQGEDVSPRYDHKHGFRVGRVLRLPGTGTTAIRKVYPSGVE